MGSSDPVTLAGRRIVVTRRPEQAGALRDALVQAGATVICCPLLRIEPPADSGPLDLALQELAEFDWLVFTSRNGVEQTLARLQALALAPVQWPAIAVVGAGTAEVVRAHGLDVSLIPEQQDAHGLAAALGQQAVGMRVLLPQAQNAASSLAESLQASGARCTVVEAYQGLTAQPTIDWNWDDIDVVTFASSATVKRFAALPGLPAVWPACVAIGPRTAETICALGQELAAEASEPTIAALVDATICACLHLDT